MRATTLQRTSAGPIMEMRETILVTTTIMTFVRLVHPTHNFLVHFSVIVAWRMALFALGTNNASRAGVSVQSAFPSGMVIGVGLKASNAIRLKTAANQVALRPKLKLVLGASVVIKVVI